MRKRNEYGERLEGALQRKGWSIDELARRTGYPADLVSPLLSAGPEVTEHMNVEICQALDLDARDMWLLAEQTWNGKKG